MAEKVEGNPNPLSILEDILQVLVLLAPVLKMLVEIVDRDRQSGG